MTVEEQVRAAASPREALFVLARAIDELIANGTPDPWSSWSEEPEAPSVRGERLMDHLKELQYLHSEASEGEDKLALEAKIRLLEDEIKGHPHVDYTELEGRPGIDEDEQGNTVVELPPVTEERKKQRREFAQQIGLEDDLIEVYVKGGPLWLYYDNRPYVMQLPVEWRRDMVLDVMETNPGEAHDLGRDILKDEEPESAEEVLDRIG